jgi:hypothetical protein
VNFERRSKLIAIGLMVAIVAVWGFRRATPVPTWQVARKFGPLPHVQPANSRLLAKDGNVHLYIDTDAFEPDVVDICVTIDGTPVLSDAFKYDLHNRMFHYCVRLAPGKHRLLAVSERGQAQTEEIIEVTDKLYVSISYTYYAPSWYHAEVPPFFNIHSEPTPWVPDSSVVEPP